MKRAPCWGSPPVAAAGLGPTSPAYGGLACDGFVSFRSELAADGTTASGARRSSLGLQVWPRARGVTRQIDAEYPHPSPNGVTLRLVLPRGRQLVPGPGGALLVVRAGATGGTADFALGPAMAGESPNGGAWLAPGSLLRPHLPPNVGAFPTTPSVGSPPQNIKIKERTQFPAAPRSVPLDDTPGARYHPCQSSPT